jgi:hypothetical protein
LLRVFASADAERRVRFAAAMGLRDTEEWIECSVAVAWPQTRRCPERDPGVRALASPPRASARRRTTRRSTASRTSSTSGAVRDQKEEVTDFTKVYLQSLLAHTNGNQSLAAKLAASTAATSAGCS